MRLGSLFDGSGTAPLAAAMCGIEPVWASEVEPYPVAVTRTHFPEMQHLGDITKINGRQIAWVDIICGGSPCQDLSVAGKRAGIHEGERSHLFFEMTRIIREMREASHGKYPRYIIWENVPGAFSSNNGRDFLAVLQAFAELADPEVHVPEPPHRGKTDRLDWQPAGSIVGDGWSIAWRTVDAQYWGVPQRRRRIYLVLDLRGERAREVLFEREGVRGYFETGRVPWQGTPADAEGGSGADDRAGRVFEPRSMKEENWAEQAAKNALRANASASSHVVVQSTAYAFDSLDSNAMKSSNPRSGCRAVEISKTLDAHGPDPTKNQGGIAIVEALPFDTTQITNPLNGNNPKWGDPCHPLAAQGHPPTVIAKTYDARGDGDGETVNTLTGDHNNRITDYSSVIVEIAPIYCLDGDKMGKAERAGGSGLGISSGDSSYTLTAKDRHAAAYAQQSFGTYKESNVASALKQRDYKDATDLAVFVDTTHADDVVRVDVAVSPLQARDHKGGKLVWIEYIVRRLTPTECARLQGFADFWGNVEPLTDFTVEEYHFWLDVRNTHAAINGRPEKAYTKAQMLKWYNGLHTDSSEYKMWGNGMALPNMLHVMRGIRRVENAGASCF